MNLNKQQRRLTTTPLGLQFSILTRKSRIDGGGDFILVMF